MQFIVSAEIFTCLRYGNREYLQGLVLGRIEPQRPWKSRRSASLRIQCLTCAGRNRGKALSNQEGILQGP